MRPFKDYETTQTITGSRQLPVGAYVCANGELCPCGYGLRIIVIAKRSHK